MATLEVLPGRRPAHLARVVAGDQQGQLHLDGIGVLELVDEQPLVALAQRPAHGGTAIGMTKQVPGLHQQVVEDEPSLAAAPVGLGQNEARQAGEQPRRARPPRGIETCSGLGT